MSQNDEPISAFAFKAAKQIEAAIMGYIDEEAKERRNLEAKILNWYAKTQDEEFANYFGIIRERSGQIS